MASYDKAVLFQPGYADAYTNRGNALQALGKPKEAVASYKKAIQIEPGYLAYNNCGNAHQELGQLEEAIENYNKAIQIKPDSSEAYNNYGNTLKKLGRFEEAETSYEKVIQFKPDDTEAHRNISTLKKYKPNDAQIELMMRLHEKDKLSQSDRINICFALAKANEGLSEYDKSFSYLEEGNRLRKKELSYDFDKDKKLVFKIKEIFNTGNWHRDTTSDEDASIQPIFIVGMPRSGTSLVEQILASHTQVHGAGELEVMDQLLSGIVSAQDAGKIKNKLFVEEIKAVRNGYIEALAALKVPEKIITDKMPLNFIYIGFILSSFPNAKIIHLNRDPRATCWSIYKNYFSSNRFGYAYDLDDLAEFYKLYIELMSFWNKQFPNCIYDVCYEDLTINQEEETRKLLDFCDLKWEKQCLDFHKTKRAVNTTSATQVRKEMYRGSSDAWKKYEQQLQPLINSLSHL